MQIECAFFGPFRETVGRKTVQWETDATTAGELLAELEAEYGLSVVDDGAVRDGLTVTHNGKYLAHRDGLDTELVDGDVIRFTNAVYGG